MPAKLSLVINSSPLIALTSALPDFQALGQIIERFIIPSEVLAELSAGHLKDETALRVRTAEWCEVRPLRLKPLRPWLNSLGAGEASVLETALEEGWPIVGIDELKGRRIARLHGLQVIGSLGILVEAYRAGIIPSIDQAVARMKAKGIFLSEAAIRAAREASGGD